MMIKIKGYCNCQAISCDIVTAYSRKISILVVKKKKMKRMSFYTDDITGRYVWSTVYNQV